MLHQYVFKYFQKVPTWLWRKLVLVQGFSSLFIFRVFNYGQVYMQVNTLDKHRLETYKHTATRCSSAHVPEVNFFDNMKASRKHACIILTPFNPTLTVKLGFTWGIHHFFSYFAKNIDCGFSLEPPRQGGGSNEYPQSMFWEYEKYQNFFYLKFSLFGCKNFNKFEKAIFRNGEQEPYFFSIGLHYSIWLNSDLCNILLLPNLVSN